MSPKKGIKYKILSRVAQSSDGKLIGQFLIDWNDGEKTEGETVETFSNEHEAIHAAVSCARIFAEKMRSGEIHLENAVPTFCEANISKPVLGSGNREVH